MWKYLAFALSLVAASNAWAGPYDPIVTKAWVDESLPGKDSSELQLNLTTIKAVKLLSVSSPAAESIEIHNKKMHRGKSEIRVLNSLSLPAHRTTTFGSNGLFLMMTGLKQPLNTGDRVPLSLTFVYADKKIHVISTEAEIKKIDLSYKRYGPDDKYNHR